MALPLNQEIVLMCAFRYSLGRQTYVVKAYVEYLHSLWYDLSETTKSNHVREIEEYREKFGSAGMKFDDAEWQTIIDRYNNLETKYDSTRRNCRRQR